MKTATVITLFGLLATVANAFVTVAPPTTASHRRMASPVDSNNEDDFDAPVERAMAVGNVVQSQPPKIMGVLPVPSFLAKSFGVRLDYDNGDNNNNDRELMELDDECYLGKDGDLDDCADFDPPAGAMKP